MGLCIRRVISDTLLVPPLATPFLNLSDIILFRTYIFYFTKTKFISRINNRHIQYTTQYGVQCAGAHDPMIVSDLSFSWFAVMAGRHRHQACCCTPACTRENAPNGLMQFAGRTRSEFNYTEQCLGGNLHAKLRSCVAGLALIVSRTLSLYGCQSERHFTTA